MARFLAPCLLPAILAAPLRAAPTASSNAAPGEAGFPEWQFGTTAHLAATQDDPIPTNDPGRPGDLSIGHDTDRPALDLQPSTPAFPAAQEADSADGHGSQRRLAAPKDEFAHRSGRLDSSGHGTPQGLNFGLPLESVYTTVTALAIVIGLFLLFMWLLRRGSRHSTSVLPPEVVRVLGRVPLSTKQFVELLRVGNKLLLVSITSDGVKPLTEVTDPAEVDCLVGLCQQYDSHSTTKAFEEVFRQLTHDPPPDALFAQPTRQSSQVTDSIPPTHGGDPRRA